MTQANLVQAQAQASNFAQSILTGACLENLRINRQSSFEQVTCQYLYLKYYQRRRVPQSNQRNLTSEEFNSTIDDLLGSINVVFNDRINWDVFRRGFRNLQRQYLAQAIRIKAIKVLCDRRFLIKIRVFLGSEVDAIK